MQKYIVEINNKRTIHWLDFETGNYHRENGPAVEYANGGKEWWFNGLRHRTDGPAIEWPDGYKEWWFEGTRYTEKEFNKKVNSCEGKTVEIDGKKYKLTLCE